MKNFKTLCACVCAASIFFSSVSWATSGVAELISANGKVLVQKAKGFEPAISPMLLQPGDKVMVKADSSAEIKYLGGCTVNVSELTMVRVTEKPPCGNKQTAALAGDFVIQPTFGGDSTILLILAVILIGAGIFVLADNNNDSPTSP